MVISTTASESPYISTPAVSKPNHDESGRGIGSIKRIDLPNIVLPADVPGLSESQNRLTIQVFGFADGTELDR